MKLIDMYKGMKVGFTDPINNEIYIGYLTDAKVIDDEGLICTTIELINPKQKVLAPIEFLLGVL